MFVRRIRNSLRGLEFSDTKSFGRTGYQISSLQITLLAGNRSCAAQRYTSEMVLENGPEMQGELGANGHCGERLCALRTR